MPAVWVGTLVLGCSATKGIGDAEDGEFGTGGDKDPVVEISAPYDGQHLYVDTKIRFAGVVTDDLDESTALEAWWRSDLEGRLDIEARPDGDGLVEGFGYLAKGDHALMLSAVDSAGHVTAQSIVVAVGPPNKVPECAIINPADGDGGPLGEMVVLTAEVSDADIPADQLSVTWESDLDGALGSPSPSTDGTAVLPIDSMEVGTHLITLTVTDEVGASCVDQVVYGVGEGPTVNITSPADGDVVAQGDGILLSGTVLDLSERVDILDVTWTSSLDGVLHTGHPDTDGVTQLEVVGLAVGGHSIVLSAKNSTGLMDSDTISLTVDGAPTQPEVLIGPRPATSSDDLVAIVTTPSEDPEGTAIVYTYTWYRSGVLYPDSESATVDAAATTRDEEWRLVVTPSDGLSMGPSGEAVAIIENSPPVVDTVEISPDSPATGDDLTCVFTVSDQDGDEVTTEISWILGGETLGATGATLDNIWTDTGDTVSCTVIGHDGTEDGEPVNSGDVLIGNTAPSITGVRIVPDELVVGDSPTCVYDGYSDVDGDPDASTISWTIDDVVVGTDALLDYPIEKHDELTCTVTPSDGWSDGTPQSATETVLNSPPTIEEGNMYPEPAYADDTLSCTALGVGDLDGDDVTLLVTWYVNGGIARIGGSLSDMFVRGDSVSCVIAPHDGEDDGTPVFVLQTIRNSEPSITDVTITPAVPSVGDTLTCESVGYADIDGDEEESTVTWLINGAATGVTTWTLSTGFSSGDIVTCVVTPADGDSEGVARTESVTVSNTAPVITSASLGPDLIMTDSVVIASVDAEDEDGDSITLDYSWSVNGIAAGASEAELDGTLWFDRGDEIRLTVTADDGITVSEPASAGPVTVDNAIPTIPAVLITPSEPLEGEDDLVCEVATPSTDSDGDTLIYTVVWTADGSVVTDTDTAVLDGDTIAAEVPVGNEEWTCEITPYDGIDAGASGTDTVTIISAIGRTEDYPAISCAHLIEEWPGATDGTYWVDPAGEGAFEVYCDMTTGDGGWTRVATAPSNRGAPEAWSAIEEVDRSACVDGDGWCKFSDYLINTILDYGSDTDDRFMLIAEGLPIHTHYYWDTDDEFDSQLMDSSSTWWQVALSFGGSHSPGCMPEDGRGLGHATSGACASDFGGDVSNRVFWFKPDGEMIGADADGSFHWYAR